MRSGGVSEVVAQLDEASHARRLRFVFGNPFAEVETEALVKVARAIGIRPWDGGLRPV